MTRKFTGFTAFALLLGVALGAGACGGGNATPTPAPTASGSPLAVATGTLNRPSDQAGNNTGIEIGGIKCEPAATIAGYATSGVNAKFTIKLIFSDGKAYRPSANIAVLASCTYWLHTDDQGNVIFSAPTGTSLPNLGTLFSLWRTTNANDPFVDMLASAFSNKVTAADGTAIANWQNYVIKDGGNLVTTAAGNPTAPPSTPTPVGSSSSIPSSTPSSTPLSTPSAVASAS